MENKDACGIWDKIEGCLVPVSKLEALPCYHRETITADYLDAMDHMNVRFYMALYDTSIWHFFVSYGLDETYFHKNHSGVFALKHVISIFQK